MFNRPRATLTSHTRETNEWELKQSSLLLTQCEFSLAKDILQHYAYTKYII